MKIYELNTALTPPATPTEGEEEEDDSVIEMVALRWSLEHPMCQ